MRQMDLGARRLEHISRPIPAIGRLQDDLGSGPARATSRANATGSLSILTVDNVSPASVIRTITDRRRCRSIPTYCRDTAGLPSCGL